MQLPCRAEKMVDKFRFYVPAQGHEMECTMVHGLHPGGQILITVYE